MLFDVMKRGEFKTDNQLHYFFEHGDTNSWPVTLYQLFPSETRAVWRSQNSFLDMSRCRLMQDQGTTVATVLPIDSHLV
jgi:hypothetical protein